MPDSPTMPAIELWRAPTLFDGFPRPGTPRRIVRGRLDTDALLIGRFDGDPTGEHLAWTGPQECEDLQLSRSQLRLARVGDRWSVAVPGPPGSKRDATVQYWASANEHTLAAGDPPRLLDAGAHACVVVHTDLQFCWALVSVPPESPDQPVADAPAPPGREGPGVTSAEAPLHLVGELKPTWKKAVIVKFEPYLTWPMGWRPAPVLPSQFIDPATDRPVEMPNGYPLRVRHGVRQAMDWAARNEYARRTENGIEVELLLWLVRHGQLTFDEDRQEWREWRGGEEPPETPG